MFFGCCTCLVQNRSANEHQRLYQWLVLFHRMGVSMINHLDHPLLMHTKWTGVLLYQRQRLVATSAWLSANPSYIHARMFILHAGVTALLDVQRPERRGIGCAAAYARRP
jgi:hypothetical protein